MKVHCQAPQRAYINAQPSYKTIDLTSILLSHFAPFLVVVDQSLSLLYCLDEHSNPSDGRLAEEHIMATVEAPNLDDDLFSPNTPADARRASHRYSAFDTHLFANYQPAASPATTKRALEAHLLETDRRLEEASKLGTALVQQRQDLADSLKEVEGRQNGQEIGPELRQRLAEVEKEYNELGRESARAFLSHKSRATINEDGSEIRVTLTCSTRLPSSY